MTQSERDNRHAKYRQSWKSVLKRNSEAWRTAVQNRDFSGRNMHFLLRILSNLNVSRPKFAAMLGVSCQQLNYWLTNDDCHLSRLQKAFGHMGYRLECTLTVIDGSPLDGYTPENPVPGQRENRTKDGGSSDGFTVVMPACPELPAPVRVGGTVGSVGEDARLYFLAKVIKERNMHLRTFCRVLGLDYIKVFKNIRRDDMLISTILEIAQKAMLSVCWSLRPLTPEEKEEVCRREAGQAAAGRTPDDEDTGTDPGENGNR